MNAPKSKPKNNFSIILHQDVTGGWHCHNTEFGLVTEGQTPVMALKSMGIAIERTRKRRAA
jgi:hypothetical protein